MSRIKIVAALAGLSLFALLAACQHTYGGLDVGQATPSSPARPVAPLPGYSLRFSDDGANAKLIYAQSRSGGAVEADGDVGLMLECEHGSGTIHLTGSASPSDTPLLNFASETGRSQVETQRQDFEGRTLWLGQTRADAPAFAGFRRSGRLTVGVGERSYLVQADEAARASPMTRFFVACERRAG